MKYLGLVLLIVGCLFVVAFIHIGDDVIPTQEYIGHKVIQDPYPAPATKTPAPYPEPKPIKTATSIPTVIPTIDYWVPAIYSITNPIYIFIVPTYEEGSIMITPLK